MNYAAFKYRDINLTRGGRMRYNAEMRILELDDEDEQLLHNIVQKGGFVSETHAVTLALRHYYSEVVLEFLDPDKTMNASDEAYLYPQKRKVVDVNTVLAELLPSAKRSGLEPS